MFTTGSEHGAHQHPFVMVRYLLLILAILTGRLAFPSHVIGGEMYYDYLGGDQYQFTVILYRDCGPTAEAPLPNQVAVGVYDGVTNDYLFQQTFQPIGPPVSIPVTLDNPCLSIPPNACIESRTYQGVVSLPFSPNGYQLSYQVCCRTATIVNVNDPGNVGLSLLVRLPGAVFGNSSPRYNELPPVALCLGENFVFDHSATDPDGDELVYELCSPFLGGSGGLFGVPQPIPSTDTQPPYATIPWGAGYSAADPITANPPTSIDPSTGLLSFTPTQAGRYVVGVCVSEFQNGELLSTSRRDFMFQVVPCDAAVSSVIAPQADFCTDLTIDFANGSAGASDFLWDFGDPASGNDTSTEADPSWTYAAPGSYTVTLITGPGLTCADTTTAVFNVFLDPEPTFTPPDPSCGTSDVILTAQGGFGSAATVVWNFGPGATPSTGQGVQVSSTFGPAGTQPVTVTVTENGCTGSFTADVVVVPDPTAAIVPQVDPCGGLVVAFGNGSSGADGFQWDFGVPGTNDDTSDQANPTYTYPGPGTYPVTLVATTGICADTATAVFVVADTPAPIFTVPEAACGAGEVTLTATGNFTNNASVTWSFPGATPPTATGTSVTTVFPGTGANPVTVTVTEHGCTGTYSDVVVVHAQPDAFFTANPGSPVPLGVEVVFVNGSEPNGATITNFTWTVDGQQVAEGATWVWAEAPPGEHLVTLTVTTADGCTDSYSMVYVVIPEEIDIPNVFTPNGDGMNDTFNIANVEFYRNQLTVFNRWGQVVYEVQNYRNQWAGRDLPDGTYYYLLRLTDTGREFTGHVTLLR